MKCSGLSERELENLRTEIKRLRSDEWLREAATNVADEAHRVVGGTLYAEDIFRILRKHRDG